MKSYTDIEQSKTLSGILSLESADMCYSNDGTAIKIDANSYTVRYSMWKDYVAEIIPCWSLAALLGVLPDDLKDNHFLTLSKEKDEYCCCYEDINGNSFRHTFANNPVDACVAMIEKLHELKML